MTLDLSAIEVPQPVFSAVSPQILPVSQMTSEHLTVGLQLEPGPRNGKQALIKSPDVNQTSSFLLVNCPQALSSHSAQYVSSAQNVAGTAQFPSNSTGGHKGANQPSQKIYSVPHLYPVVHQESIALGSLAPESQTVHLKKPCFQASILQQPLILQPKIMVLLQKKLFSRIVFCGCLKLIQVSSSQRVVLKV